MQWPSIVTFGDLLFGPTRLLKREIRGDGKVTVQPAVEPFDAL